MNKKRKGWGQRKKRPKRIFEVRPKREASGVPPCDFFLGCQAMIMECIGCPATGPNRSWEPSREGVEAILRNGPFFVFGRQSNFRQSGAVGFGRKSSPPRWEPWSPSAAPIAQLPFRSGQKKPPRLARGARTTGHHVGAKIRQRPS